MNIKYYSSKSQPSNSINIDLFLLIIDCPIIAFKRAFYETIFFKLRLKKEKPNIFYSRLVFKRGNTVSPYEETDK